MQKFTRPASEQFLHDTLDSLIRALSVPADLDKVYTDALESRRKMGTTNSAMFDSRDWIVGQFNESREKEAAEAVEKRDALRAKWVVDMLAALGDEFSHYSIRYSGQHGYGTPSICIYRKDRKSPTGCIFFGSVTDCALAREAVGSCEGDYIGARRGHTAGV